jgi:hypothetical protein
MLSLVFYNVATTLSIMTFRMRIKSKTLRIIQLAVMLSLLFYNVTITLSIITFSITIHETATLSIMTLCKMALNNVRYFAACHLC